jgi:hypothetical protein
MRAPDALRALREQGVSVTYRQLDHWRRSGFLGEIHLGYGTVHAMTDDEVYRLTVLGAAADLLGGRLPTSQTIPSLTDQVRILRLADGWMPALHFTTEREGLARLTVNLDACRMIAETVLGRKLVA